MVQGQWSCKPPEVIFANDNVEFGAVSGGGLLKTGTSGKVVYRPEGFEDKLYFMFDNSAVGNTKYNTNKTPQFKVETKLKGTNNATIFFYICDNASGKETSEGARLTPPMLPQKPQPSPESTVPASKKSQSQSRADLISKSVFLSNENPKQGFFVPKKRPKNFLALVEHLRTHGVKEKGLFMYPGAYFEIINLKEQYETNAGSIDFTKYSLSSIASVLKQLLKELPEGPLLPSSHIEAFVSPFRDGLKSPSEEFVKQFLYMLGESHRALFKRLIRMFCAISNSKETGVSSHEIATIFVGIICPDVIRIEKDKDWFDHHLNVIKMLDELIQNYDKLFKTPQNKE